MRNILKEIENSPMMDIVEQEYLKRWPEGLSKGDFEVFKLATCIMCIAEKKAGVSGKFISDMMAYSVFLFQSNKIKKFIQDAWLKEAFEPDLGKLRTGISEYHLKVAYYLITLLSVTSIDNSNLEEDDEAKFTMFLCNLMAYSAE